MLYPTELRRQICLPGAFPVNPAGKNYCTGVFPRCQAARPRLDKFAGGRYNFPIHSPAGPWGLIRPGSGRAQEEHNTWTKLLSAGPLPPKRPP